MLEALRDLDRDQRPVNQLARRLGTHTAYVGAEDVEPVGVDDHRGGERGPVDLRGEGVIGREPPGVTSVDLLGLGVVVEDTLDGGVRAGALA